VNFEKYNPYKSYPKNDGAVTPSFGPATLSAGARLTGANFRLSLDGAKIALVADGKERMAAVEANTGKKLYEFKTEYKMRRVIGGASDESTDLSNPCQFTSHCPGDDYSGQQRLIDETRVTIHPDGRSFVTASNKSVKLFDAQQGEYPLTVKLLDPDDFSNGKFTTNRGAFDSAGWSKDGKIFFVVDYLKKSISLWAFERN
jgi:WD40 repeat protein